MSDTKIKLDDAQKDTVRGIAFQSPNVVFVVAGKDDEDRTVYAACIPVDDLSGIINGHSDVAAITTSRGDVSYVKLGAILPTDDDEKVRDMVRVTGGDTDNAETVRVVFRETFPMFTDRQARPVTYRRPAAAKVTKTKVATDLAAILAAGSSDAAEVAAETSEKVTSKGRTRSSGTTRVGGKGSAAAGGKGGKTVSDDELANILGTSK